MKSKPKKLLQAACRSTASSYPALQRRQGETPDESARSIEGEIAGFLGAVLKDRQRVNRSAESALQPLMLLYDVALLQVCDMSHFGFKQVSLGITPAWGGRSRLVRLVGRARALMLLLSGELIEAGEAERIGLADKVVPQRQVLAAAIELAEQIAANPPLAVRAIKRAVNYDCAAGKAEAVAFEADLFAETWISDDHQEALAARKEKRPPKFTGQ